MVRYELVELNLKMKPLIYQKIWKVNSLGPEKSDMLVGTL